MLLFADAQLTSPYAMSVFVGLKEKGLPFTMQTVDLDAGANRADDYAALSAIAQQAVQKLFKAAETLLAHGGENLFDAWCIADVDLALMLNRLIANGDPVPARLADYAMRQWSRASVQEWVALTRPPL